MCVAFISATERGADGRLLADRTVLGRTVAEWQVALALELGATTIVCLAQAPTTGIVAAAHMAETSGADFTATARVSPLVPLLAGADRVIMIADGTYIHNSALSDSLRERNLIAAFPAEAATPFGFERIDAAYAWAGLLITDGDVAGQLSALPEEFDPHSALLRLALQAGAQIVPLSAEVLDRGIVAKEVTEQTRARNSQYFSERSRLDMAGSPGQVLSSIAAKHLLHSMIDDFRVLYCIGALSLMLLLASLVSAVYIATSVALGIGLFAVFVAAMFTHGMRFRCAAYGTDKLGIISYLDWISDAVLFCVLALSPVDAQYGLQLVITAALLLTIQIVRILPPQRLAILAGDRILLWGGLCIASMAELLSVAISTILIAILAALLVTSHNQRENIS